MRGYIRKGVDEGAKLVTGGAEAPDGLDHGYFVQPTVFSDVRTDMTIAQEEIFGPVLSIIPYDDEEDAIRIANDTIYGLAGGVWSGDQERAKRVARRMRTGQVEINGGGLQPARAVRRLQAVRPRPRARPVRPGGVPPGEVHAAVVALLGTFASKRRRLRGRQARTQGARVPVGTRVTEDAAWWFRRPPFAVRRFEMGH